VTYFKFENT